MTVAYSYIDNSIEKQNQKPYALVDCHMLQKYICNIESQREGFFDTSNILKKMLTIKGGDIC